MNRNKLLLLYLDNLFSSAHNIQARKLVSCQCKWIFNMVGGLLLTLDKLGNILTTLTRFLSCLKHIVASDTPTFLDPAVSLTDRIASVTHLEPRVYLLPLYK